MTPLVRRAIRKLPLPLGGGGSTSQGPMVPTRAPKLRRLYRRTRGVIGSGPGPGGPGPSSFLGHAAMHAMVRYMPPELVASSESCPGNRTPEDGVEGEVTAEIEIGGLVAGFAFLLAAGGLVAVNLMGARDGLRESRRRSAQHAA
jgi:hypothetical protein